MAKATCCIPSSVPDVLTVEEAARVLRISRTTAYAMALEWRVTGGKSGLKVIEIGGQLRVPRAWLEELLGAPIENIPDPPSDPKKEEPADPKKEEPSDPKKEEPSAPESDKKSPSSQDPKPQHGPNKKKKKGRAA